MTEKYSKPGTVWCIELINIVPGFQLEYKILVTNEGYKFIIERARSTCIFVRHSGICNVLNLKKIKYNQ